MMETLYPTANKLRERAYFELLEELHVYKKYGKQKFDGLQKQSYSTIHIRTWNERVL